MLLLCIHNSFNFEKISDPTGWNVAPKPWQNVHSHSLLLIEWMNWTKSWKFGFISSFIRRISLSLTVHLLIRTITSSFVLQFLSFRYFANPVGIRWDTFLGNRSFGITLLVPKYYCVPVKLCYSWYFWYIWQKKWEQMMITFLQQDASNKGQGSLKVLLC